MKTTDEIMALADQASDDRHMCGSPTYNAQAAQSRNALKQSVEALAKDVARYKLMKSMSRVSSLDMSGNHTYSCQIMNRRITGATLDEALDKAIEAAQAEVE